jgi:hypothetical protein
MAITTIFSRKQDTVTPPALKRLWDHLDLDRALVKESETISARIKQINGAIKRADDLQARIQAITDSIAAAEADDQYHGLRVRDQSAERGRLTELENELKPASEAARVGKLVLAKLQADTEALSKKRAELKGTTDTLLREAAIEEALSLKTEYLAARAAMLAVARKMFGALLAADTITKEQRVGVFQGSGLYQDLNIPLPPAFNPNPLGPEAAQRARNDDLAQVGHEAATLVNALLTERG